MIEKERPTITIKLKPYLQEYLICSLSTNTGHSPTRKQAWHQAFLTRPSAAIGNDAQNFEHKVSSQTRTQRACPQQGQQ